MSRFTPVKYALPSAPFPLYRQPVKFTSWASGQPEGKSPTETLACQSKNVVLYLKCVKMWTGFIWLRIRIADWFLNLLYIIC